MKAPTNYLKVRLIDGFFLSGRLCQRAGIMVGGVSLEREEEKRPTKSACGLLKPPAIAIPLFLRTSEPRDIAFFGKRRGRGLLPEGMFTGRCRRDPDERG